jgi:hypothetical protein
MQIKSTAVPIPGFVYIIGTDEFSWYKIGFSKSCEIRADQLGILLPFKIELFAAWRSYDARALEKEFHSKYARYNIHGEWFGMTWEQRDHLIDHPPSALHAELIFPTTGFVRKRSITTSSPGSYARKQDTRWKCKRNNAEHAAVDKYMKDRGMKSTKENYAIAWREAVLEPKRLQRNAKLDML